MKSKKSQLMLLVGALTVSFAAQAAVVQDGTRSENPIEETDKATDANLFGHVVDTKTGEHLPYVTIQLKGTTIGTTTDHTGHYFLKNLPEGTFTMVVKFLGYKTEERTVTVQHNTTQEVNFSLSTDDVAIDEVVVFPWVPATQTALGYFFISSPQDCARSNTGIPAARAAAISGLSSWTAAVRMTRSAPAMLAGSWPMATEIPPRSSRSVVSLRC